VPAKRPKWFSDRRSDRHAAQSVGSSNGILVTNGANELAIAVTGAACDLGAIALTNLGTVAGGAS
jgi:hypothetical protein